MIHKLWGERSQTSSLGLHTLAIVFRLLFPQDSILDLLLNGCEA